MEKIIFATKNIGKVRELKELFKKHKLNYELISLRDLPEDIEIIEDGATFLENALKKAKAVYQRFKLPVIADDSGLIVKALVDKPGVFSARYAGENATDEENNRKLLEDLKQIKNREAFFECALVYISSNGKVHKVQERCFGKIIDIPKGDKGFGYDPIFLVSEFGKTMAELEIHIKNEISHRGKAFKKLLNFLEG